jgi:leucyl aminopeptidase
MPDQMPTQVHFVAQAADLPESLSAPQRAFATAAGFSGQRGRLQALPAEDGSIAAWLFGVGSETGRPAMIAGTAGAALPPGTYALAGDLGDPTRAAIGFRLGAYRYTRYRAGDAEPDLAPPDGSDQGRVDRIVTGARLARDLINTPANDLGPDALEAAVRALAQTHGADIRVTRGDDLLAAGFPMIHAVGRAAAEAPRLVDLTWGAEGAPRVTLVGKGVTFDTGGLDIKPASGMALMKKDMGGAANVLGLAHAIMDAGLPVRLRVLVPIVENAISASSFRPGDVLRSRKGITVEIGNTDAEGRLILADALAFADEEAPELMIDMATLTGAARVALGPDLPPLYCADDALASQIVAAGMAEDDPLWHMPLWSPYESLLSSRIADINNAASGGYAGSVTAALFLRRFVENASAWVHLDIFGWAPENRPSRPVGGTDQSLRALYAVLAKRYPAR